MALKGGVLLVILAYGLNWLLNNPVPEGFHNPWELRFIMADLKIQNQKLYLREYRETLADIYISRRGNGSEVQPDPLMKNVKIKTEDLVLGGVNVRLYTPESRLKDEKSPAVVFFHGGGFMLGSVASYDQFCRSFSNGTQMKVFSVDYRRAPEHPYPIPLEDCVTASRHVLENAASLGLDAARIAIAGDSAGGNLAASTILKLKELQIQPQPKLQVLIVPMLQAINFKTSSYQLFEEDPLLPKRIIASSFHLYAFGHGEHVQKLMENKHTTPEIKQQFYEGQLSMDLIPPNLRGQHFRENENNFGDAQVWNEVQDVFLDKFFCPLMADDLSGLPEAVVMTMGQDVLRDDGFFYANYLKSFGVKVKHHHYKSGYHAVITWPVLYNFNVYEARSILYQLVRERL